MESEDDQVVKDRRVSEAVSTLLAEWTLDVDLEGEHPRSPAEALRNELLALLNGAILTQSLLLEQWAAETGESRSEVLRRFALRMASKDGEQGP
ncbi:hypothetical protein E1264_11695 [Actinomadura sp. KC216]|uniref:hypothetical protein n=1 Tax=Actinomadura sp. KC216 TaxID=2530370 RepID=UPI00104AB99D|nr:hypothetical protein [Actinomadura sp. KC216]TDB88339.1 hypothetical protein E1264_11695 [Actinomadura sp. KC216]